MPSFFEQFLQDNSLEQFSGNVPEIQDFVAPTQEQEILEGGEPFSPQDFVDELSGATSTAVDMPVTPAAEDLVIEAIDAAEANALAANDESVEQSITEPEDRFGNFFQKAGFLIAAAAAIKGDTNPLRLMLSAHIGQQQAKVLDKKQRAALKKQRASLAKQNAETAKIVAETEALKKGKWVPLTGNKGHYQFNNVTGEIKTLFSAPGSTKEEATIEVIKEGLTFKEKTITITDSDGNSKKTGTLTPFRVDKPITKHGTSGEFQKRTSITIDKETGRPRFIFRVELTEFGIRKREQELREIHKDDFVRGTKVFELHEPLKIASKTEARAKTIFAFMDDIMATGRLGPSSIGIINQFQQMIDDATVREGDVDLIISTLSRLKVVGNEYYRTTEDQLVPFELIRDLAASTKALAEGQRELRGELVKDTVDAIRAVYDKKVIKKLEVYGNKMYNFKALDINMKLYDRESNPPLLVSRVKQATRDFDGAELEAALDKIAADYPKIAINSAWLLRAYEELEKSLE